MRPQRLIPIRKRMQGFAVSYAFRLADGLILAGLAVAGALSVAGGRSESATIGKLSTVIGLALIAATTLAAAGAYEFRRKEKVGPHLARVAVALAGAGLVALACLAVTHAPQPTERAALAEAALALLVLPPAHGLWMALVGHWRRLGYLTPNIVIIGANDNALRLIERAAASGEVAVLGIFDDRLGRAPSAIAGVAVLGDTEAMLGHRIMPYVDRVVITVTASARDRVKRLVQRLEALPNDVTLFLDQGQPDAVALRLDHLVDLPLARLTGEPPRFHKVAAKRAQDLAFGALALVLAAPLMLAVALAVKLDSPGPVFFRQRRQGFNNEEIVVWKFRSMRHDPHDPGAAQQVRYDDPRITRVGRFIRRTSLDELPQLFNVLAGEMSLVGPRPHALGMKTAGVPSAMLVAHYARRHRVKPGMTGWAAINGSRGPVDTPTAVRRRVDLDIAYIERRSFWFDLHIMLMTLPCLLGDRKVAR